VDEADVQEILTTRSVTRLREIDYVVLRDQLPRNLAGDAAFGRVLFAHAHGRLPGDPSLFNDMLYEMKANGELYNPLRQFISDKELGKEFVAARVGREHTVPTLAVLHTRAAAAAYSFTSECVVKPTHMSGHVAFVHAGEQVDWASHEWWWDINYYLMGREANYAHLRPKIIVEPVLFDDPNVGDVKIFCWRGEPRIVQINLDRRTDHRIGFFDRDWSPLRFWYTSYPTPDGDVPRPRMLTKALEIAHELSRDLEFLRVDTYLSDSEVVVGELTNCPGNACERFSPEGGERMASEQLFA